MKKYIQRLTMAVFIVLITSVAYGVVSPIDQITNFNVIPTNPQVAAFDIYGNLKIQNATGTPEIIIPLYTLVEDGVSIPISLSYDASGIKVADIASEVGLKWTLHVGGYVSRSIRGLADEDEKGWFNFHDPGWTNPNNYQYPSVSWNNNINCYQLQLKDIEDNYYDILPDIYAYKLPGYQGSFFFDETNQLRKSLDDDLQIKKDGDWSCVDNKGIKYQFGENNSVSTTEVASYANGGTAVYNSARSGNGISDWKLTSITTRNGYNINFSYVNYPLSYSVTSGAVRRFNNITYNRNTTTHSTHYSFNNKLIEKIESSSALIKFIYTTESSAAVWQKKLTEIQIFSTSGDSLKRYVFGYDTYWGCAKLRLRTITEQETSTSVSARVWQFNYSDNTLPAMDSKDTDYFGYYNAAGNSSLIPLFYNPNNATYEVTNTKNVNNTAITIGMLKEIVYPTGGKTRFYYEANMDSVSGQICFAPGTRLKKSEDYPVNNNFKCNVKEYLYSGLTGNVFDGDYTAFYENYPYGPIMLYSSPKRLLNPKNGFGYRKIEALYYSNNIFSGKEVDYYRFFSVGSTIHPRIESKHVLTKSNILQQKIEYNYTCNMGCGSDKALGWRIDTEDWLGNFDYVCNDLHFDTHHFYKGIYKDYKYDTYQAILLSKVSTTDYTDNDSIKNHVSYRYDNHLQLSEEQHTTSMESIDYFKEILHPDNNLYPGLYAKGMVGLPVVVNEYKLTTTIIAHTMPNGTILNEERVDTSVVGKKKLEYDSMGNPVSLYGFINRPAYNYLLLEESYSYDSSGKLREINYKDGTSAAYLWSYNRQYPIAEVQNATIAEVANALVGTTPDQLASAIVPDMTKIEALRTHPDLLKAQITTYTYKPLVGMTSKTDSRGVKTFYEYDAFNRLKYIKDTYGNIIQKFDYHYKE